jgi:hypothetical protein
MTSLTVDDLHFEVRRSSRRGSVQITVDRGGELLIFAPEACPTHVMEKFVREKRFWVYTKLAEKEALGTKRPAKEYVNGEGFLYLGRSYRLLLVDDQEVAVKLEQGRFKLLRSHASNGRREMVRWYTEHAQPWLASRAVRFQHRVGAVPQGISVQDLGFRWGTCGKGGKLYFHWRTILLPPRIIEYVVVHALLRLREPRHTPAFWAAFERAMPSFAERKQWLAEHGAAAAVL